MRITISNEALVERTKELVRAERRVGVEVLKHLREIESRKLYLDHGYPSLFEMCIREFMYSAGGAQRRIQAMRLIRDLPQIEGRIEDGTLCLSTASRIQSHFHPREVEVRRHSRKIGIPMTELKEGIDLNREKLELVERLQGKSAREVDRELAARRPEADRTENVRYIGKDRLSLSFSISEDLYQNLEKLKQLLSHKNPSMSFEDLLGELSALALRKLDPANRKDASSRKTANPGDHRDLLPTLEVKSTRFIPLKIKRQVWNRDGGQCTFVNIKTGRRCGSRHLLQFDHIQPHSLGGPSSAENLRLLCAGHNRRRFEASSGRDAKWDGSPEPGRPKP